MLQWLLNRDNEQQTSRRQTQMPDHLSDSFWPRWQQTASTRVAIDPSAMLTGFLVFIGYYLGARIGFALTFQPHPVSVF